MSVPTERRAPAKPKPTATPEKSETKTTDVYLLTNPIKGYSALTHASILVHGWIISYGPELQLAKANVSKMVTM